jgi:hypothetical protein
VGDVDDRAACPERLVGEEDARRASRRGVHPEPPACGVSRYVRQRLRREPLDQFPYRGKPRPPAQVLGGEVGLLPLPVADLGRLLLQPAVRVRQIQSGDVL